MKKIVVPIDFSDCSINALRIAANIAKKSGAVLHMVHVYERPVYGFVDLVVDNGENQKIRDAIKKRFEALATSDFLEGVKCKRFLLADVNVKTIINHEKLVDADLLVMGSHGHEKKDYFFIGSNAEKIVRLSPAPVLVVKSDNKAFQLNDIVFASNFYGEAAASFEKIKNFATLFNAKVHLLKVITHGGFENSSKSFRMMEDFAQENGLTNYTTNTHNHQYVENGIIEFANQKQADLIALETHGRIGLSHFFNGSMAEGVALQSNIPVMSVRIKEVPIEYGVIFPESR